MIMSWALQTPPTLIEDLLATRENIVTTDCVYLDDMGEPTGRHCDGNSWAETDASRKYLKTADPAKPLFLEYGGAFMAQLRSTAAWADSSDSPGHCVAGRQSELGFAWSLPARAARVLHLLRWVAR